ncbi:hypothetical protein [Streptomyces malaysiense]|uniref:hypothetical protein n=1 Tax=Streptomyces malaysiense TaxID=1428626 RepID=UPI0009A11566|nr:hypothetical protein [Streptomyces malaysiense]
MDPELLERITARRAELDELEERLAKHSAEVRAERDELAVAERVPEHEHPGSRSHQPFEQQLQAELQQGVTSGSIGGSPQGSRVPSQYSARNLTAPTARSSASIARAGSVMRCAGSCVPVKSSVMAAP